MHRDACRSVAPMATRVNIFLPSPIGFLRELLTLTPCLPPEDLKAPAHPNFIRSNHSLRKSDDMQPPCRGCDVCSSARARHVFVSPFAHGVRRRCRVEEGEWRGKLPERRGGSRRIWTHGFFRTSSCSIFPTPEASDAARPKCSRSGRGRVPRPWPNRNSSLSSDDAGLRCGTFRQDTNTGRPACRSPGRQ